MRCLLVTPDGTSRRVGASGVLIGRQDDCEIVTSDPSASRRHALVRLTGEGVEVVPLGKAPVELNGVPSDRPAALHDGDAIAIPGLALVVRVEARPPDREVRGFVLERAGNRFGVSHTPFVIGGASDCDLIIKSLPAAPVVQLHVAQGQLFVELCAAGSGSRNDEPLESETLEPLEVGDRLGVGAEQFAIDHVGGRAATTAASGASELPRRVELELMPRGGRVTFTVAGGERAVYLADRRFDLLMALLAPPGDYRGGELVPDEVVRSTVWPKHDAVSRSEINMLISRCRKDLLAAGLAGPRLLERAKGGGATRVVLSPGAEIVVKR